MKKTISINGKPITKYFKTEFDKNKWFEEVKKENQFMLLEGEILKEIPNYSRYLASNFGRIISKNYKNSGIPKQINPHITGGYFQSMFLHDNGKYNTRKIHYLITLAFFGYRELGIVVNHIDGNKTNNNISNLEYCTQSENSLHSFRNNLQVAKRGELNGMAKLTKNDVEYLRKIASDAKKNNIRYWGRNELAKKYNISAKHLQRIVNHNDLW